MSEATRHYEVDLSIMGEFDGDPANIATWIEAAMGRSGHSVDVTVREVPTPSLNDVDALRRLKERGLEQRDVLLVYGHDDIALRSAAEALYADGSDDNIEIDGTYLTSESENGVWVSAWVFVPTEDDGEDEEKDASDEDVAASDNLGCFECGGARVIAGVCTDCGHGSSDAKGG